MQLRANFLPRSIRDALVTTFVALIIPTIYWFELFKVVPTFYETDSWMYMFQCTLGTFLMFNIASNFVAIIVCDTSIRGKLLPSTLGPHWRFCPTCECTAPPRSWHCNTCDTCILKRDHHCIFTGSCVGHYNQRYFIVFLFYTAISTAYATIFNIFYIRNNMIFDPASVFRLMFPLAMIFVDMSEIQVHLMLCVVVVIGGVFTGVLLYYHVDLMLMGAITYEKNKNIRIYDIGKKPNIVEVLGERWYLVWLSPFVDSKLPNDGINWPIENLPKAK